MTPSQIPSQLQTQLAAPLSSSAELFQSAARRHSYGYAFSQELTSDTHQLGFRNREDI